MRFITWVGLGVVAASFVSPLAAQAPVFGVGLGSSFGANPFLQGSFQSDGDRQDGGWQVQTFSEWSPARSRLTFRTEALYSRQLIERNPSNWFGIGGSILTPQPGARGFQPYVLAGGSLYTNPRGTESDTAQRHWAWSPELNGGVGFAFDLLSLRTGLEVRRFGGLRDGRGGGIAIAGLLRFR